MSTASPKKKQFRINARQLFLTYPQCTTSREVAVSRIQESPLFKDNLEWVIVSQELHQDGNTHLHVGIRLKEKKLFSSVSFADFIGGQHGNYQAMKNMKKCVAYITKADASFIAHGVDVRQMLQSAKSTATLDIAMAIKQGASLGQIDQDFPDRVLRDKRKIEEYIAYQVVKKRKLELKEWRIHPIAPAMDYAHQLIWEWLNANIKKPREFKQKQLYIYGPPNLGKTSLILYLEKYLSVYQIPTDEDFYDFYNDEDYDLAIIDEFKGNKKIQWLNQWLQGSTMPLRKKGSQAMKTKNIPVIILSNFTLEECYPKVAEHNMDRLNLLRIRLEEVHVNSFIEVPSLEEEPTLHQPSNLEEELHTGEDILNISSASVVDH